MSSLRDRLEEFKRTFESGVPPYNATREAVATMHRATAELKASGIESAALKLGDRAPDFSLFNQDHVELEALQEVDSGVRALGGRILAISPQLEKYARSVHRKLNLTFDILTDLHFIMMNPNTVCLCLPAT